MKYIAWVPFLIFFLFSLRKEILNGYLHAPIQLLGMAIIETGFVFSIVLPAFAIYAAELERISNKPPAGEVALFSTVALFVFPFISMDRAIADPLLLVLAALYIISFNKLFPRTRDHYKNFGFRSKDNFEDIFEKFPPAHMDDFSRPRLIFIVVIIISILGNIII